MINDQNMTCLILKFPLVKNLQPCKLVSWQNFKNICTKRLGFCSLDIMFNTKVERPFRGTLTDCVCSPLTLILFNYSCIILFQVCVLIEKPNGKRTQKS